MQIVIRVHDCVLCLTFFVYTVLKQPVSEYLPNYGSETLSQNNVSKRAMPFLCYLKQK